MPDSKIDYHSLVEIALEKAWPYTSDLLMTKYREDITSFCKYLDGFGNNYSPDLAANWLEAGFRGPAYLVCRHALSLVNNLIDDCSSIRYISNLTVEKGELSTWIIETIKGAGKLSYSNGYGLRRFLTIADYLGARCAEDIEHFMVAGIYDCTDGKVLGIIPFLKSLDLKKGKLHLEHAWLSYYRDATIRKEALGITNTPSNGEATIFYKTIEDAIACISRSKYKSKYVSIRCLESFKARFGLFMEANGIGYSYEVLDAWLKATKFFTNSSGEIRLPVLKVMESLQTGEDFFRVFDRHIVRLSHDRMAEWIVPYYEAYREFRKENGLSESALRMDKHAIVKFSSILSRLSCTSIKDITPDLILKFYLMDTDHKTPQGKNAYNSRIRNFLKYLEIEGIITIPLSDAVPYTAAPRTRPVEILSDEEIEQVIAWLDNGDDGSLHYYLDAALISVMLFCGLRASDTQFLRFDELDLKTMSVTKIQQKTRRYISIPIFNRVVNAIFRYIEKERPDIASPYIFVSKKSLHSLKLCNTARVTTRFAHLFGKRIGTHILRRTFASSLVRSAANNPILVAMALGHTRLSNLSKYLDTDNDRMAEVPLTLDGLAYTGRIL